MLAMSPLPLPFHCRLQVGLTLDGYSHLRGPKQHVSVYPSRAWLPMAVWWSGNWHTLEVSPSRSSLKLRQCSFPKDPMPGQNGIELSHYTAWTQPGAWFNAGRNSPTLGTCFSPWPQRWWGDMSHIRKAKPPVRCSPWEEEKPVGP